LNKDEFTREIERLIETYSPKQYPAERIKGMWTELRSVKHDVFNHAVTKLIATSNFAPMLDKIKEQVRLSSGEFFRIDVEHGECSTCNKTGSIHVQKDTEEGIYETVFRCACGWGERYNGWRTWDEDLRLEGYVRHDELS
jgi:hypothetical protein